MAIDEQAKDKPGSGAERAAGLSYVLMTAARNEAAFIGRTIESVIAQDVRPLKWIIASDGSTDGTDDIVRGYASSCGWIELVRMPEREERHFGGKAAAVNAAYERLRSLDFDIVGNVDADLVFDPDHFSALLSRFAEDDRLGVAGTPFREKDSQYDYRFSRQEHVSGACQLFRRECFEAVGGYLPMKGGGIDLVAVVTARMKGWKTKTFTDKSCIHLRPMGRAGRDFIGYTFRSGLGDYRLGVHPAWQFFRCLYQMTRKPVLISGSLLLAGYVWGALARSARPVSKEFVRFRRREQSAWLREYATRVFGGKR